MSSDTILLYQYARVLFNPVLLILSLYLASMLPVILQAVRTGSDPTVAFVQITGSEITREHCPTEQNSIYTLY